MKRFVTFSRDSDAPTNKYDGTGILSASASTTALTLEGEK